MHLFAADGETENEKGLKYHGRKYHELRKSRNSTHFDTNNDKSTTKALKKGEAFHKQTFH